MAQDNYANIMSGEVTESAAGTLTFLEMLTGAGFGSGRGFIVDEIDYFVSKATLALMTTGGDSVQFGITLSSGVTDLEDFSDNRILHSASYTRKDMGTAASATYEQSPFVYQFFPPMIHGQPKMYLGIQAAGLASAAIMRTRIMWRYTDLTPQAIMEIAETFNIVG